MKTATYKHFACLFSGVFAGTVFWSVLRLMQYKILALQPNMAPEMFVLFAPVLAVPIALISLAVHIFIRKSFSYPTYALWFVAGVCYSSIFLLLISPWLLPVVAFIYFFILRKIQGHKAH
jgi:hypothetical protein